MVSFRVWNATVRLAFHPVAKYGKYRVDLIRSEAAYGK